MKRTRLKKRGLISLAFMLVIISASTPSLAALPSGINFERLKLQNNIGHQLLMQFEDVELKGNLTKQTPMTDQELEELVQKTMEELGIDSIEELNDLIKKAKEWDQITKKEINQFIDDMITTIKAVPAAGKVAAILDVLNKQRLKNQGDKALDDLMQDMGKGELTKALEDYLDDSAANLAKQGLEADDLLYKLKDYYGALKKLADGIGAGLGYKDFLELLAEKYGQDQQKWQDRVEGSLAEAKLDQFYDELQKKIDKHKNDKKQESYWLIDFNHATGQRHNFSFFGVEGNNQIWELTMTLKQTESTGDFSFDSKNVAGSAAGTYEGEYTIKADSDLMAFAGDIDKAIMNMGDHGLNMQYNKQLTKIFHADNYYYVETKARDMARSIRTLTGRCSAYILKSGEVQLTIEAGKEEIRNEFSNIQVEIHDVTHAGTWRQPLHVALPAEIKAYQDKNMIYIDYAEMGRFVAGDPAYKWGAVIYNLEIGLLIRVMFEDEDDPELSVWDYSEIWRPWDDSIKTMRILP